MSDGLRRERSELRGGQSPASHPIASIGHEVARRRVPGHSLCVFETLRLIQQRCDANMPWRHCSPGISSVCDTLPSGTVDTSGWDWQASPAGEKIAETTAVLSSTDLDREDGAWRVAIAIRRQFDGRRTTISQDWYFWAGAVRVGVASSPVGDCTLFDGGRGACADEH